MTMRVVYDTNVIVSAALKQGSIPSSLVALALQKQIQLVVSSAILTEYEAVLKRPKFALNPQHVEAFLRDVRAAAILVRPTLRIAASPDEADNHFLESASAGKAEYLVTGNKKHFPFSNFAGTTIASPAEFARIIFP